MGVDQIVALGGVAVAFVALLLNGSRYTRETNAELESRARRDTHLERDASETKKAVGRIEGAIAGVGNKLDQMSAQIAKLTSRVDSIERRQDLADKKVSDLMDVMRSEAERSVKQ